MADHVLRYEDPELQGQVLSLMPVTELKQKSKEASQKSKQGGEGGVDEEDCLLLELLSWFKGKRSLVCVRENRGEERRGEERRGEEKEHKEQKNILKK